MTGLLHPSKTPSQTTSPNTTPTHTQPPQKPDPLEAVGLPTSLYQSLHKLIEQNHPHASLPKPNSQTELKAKNTLAQLVRIDHFQPHEVIATFRWLFKDQDSEDASFWRGQLKGFITLRKAKDGEMTKFAKIHEKWTRSTHPSLGYQAVTRQINNHATTSVKAILNQPLQAKSLQ